MPARIIATYRDGQHRFEVVIPRGWVRVTRGFVQAGDRIWDKEMRCWDQARFYAGSPISDFWVVIRRAKPCPPASS